MKQALLGQVAEIKDQSSSSILFRLLLSKKQDQSRARA
jgi:hypothetical protein